jgi:prepilin-type N-terminal cleavage/methylation domain-containing protein
MKFKNLQRAGGFTLSEILISVSISSIVLAAAIASSVSLQKSFSAVDNYFASHMQQVRIIDYLNRDVNRGFSVTTSVDLQTVTISVPNYIIRAGDSEAVANASLIGTPRPPTVAYTPGGSQINYGVSTSTVVYSVNNSSILRTENGAVTTIASSTDQLIPQTTDVELANTEYANTAITFMPTFTMSGSPAARTGTSLYGTAYLRNKRRG